MRSPPNFFRHAKIRREPDFSTTHDLPKAYTNNLKIDIVDIDDRHRRCRLRGCGRGTTQVLKERKREGKGVGDVS